MNRDDLRDLVALLALNAVDSDETNDVEAAVAAHPELADELATLREAAAWLGADTAHAVPGGLDDRVLHAAMARRAAGRHVAVEAAGIPTPIDALAGEAADFAALLSGLSEADWAAPTRAGLTVHELVAHLVGVEQYTGALLGLWPSDVDPDTVLDHMASTRPTIAAWHDRPSAELAATWRQRIGAVIDGARTADPSQRFQFHYLDLSLRSLVVLRTFELWIHGDDILDALGRPASLGHPGRINLMAALVIRGLPLALGLAGIDTGDATVRLVLTGPGGGTWDQRLGARAGDSERPAPAVRIVADVHDFCRLVGHRLRPDQLDVDVSGDADLAQAVVAGARIFEA